MEDKDKFFRTLDITEQESFRKWARSNFTPGIDEVNYLWHPIVIEECEMMIKELKEELL